MHSESIPGTPPPPYQTLPPTPVLSPAPSHSQLTAGHSRPVTFNSHSTHPPQGPTVFYYPQPTTATYPTVHHHQGSYHTPNQAHPWPLSHAHTGGHQNAHSNTYNQSGCVPPPRKQRPWQSCMNLTSLAATLNDAGNLAVETYDAFAGQKSSRQQYTAALDAVGMRLDEVITSMDNGTYRGETDEIVLNNIQPEKPAAPALPPRRHERHNKPSKDADKKHHSTPTQSHTRTRIPPTSSSFTKSYHYANAYTPSSLPMLKLHFETWPLLCLAATYSRRAYDKPSGAERHMHISGDWLRGTKDMLIKSVPLDDMNTIVFAIRGTQNFRDWAVNMHTQPTSPSNFLDDEGNLCHSGFLNVARKMVKPVARRLQDLLNEDPRRASCSLVITGHSAGGAVAALLFTHMLSQTVTSELTHLRGFFKRVHCVTFGAPPVSLLPLHNPELGSDRDNRSRYNKNMFFGFVNEGDPVARADKTYVKSLLEMYARPTACINNCSKKKNPKPVWKVPEATLSLAGRLVVLRTTSSSSSSKKKKARRMIEAVIASDADLRGLVFGDPLMHAMDLYAQRIEQLATEEVVGRLRVS
ncbi:Alpha/Beta hydrolase protein [Talaromyces proteolyticus]|uniref:Alpha/Beta hydrolase protein n=1 Tax=Talaromyces proteolyticus TaxID=1131652 RepID=A0AAD4KH42_9EURO|nr:Alpha/Beta hydrolase protein [Talaromyces proteolyticus]KAH8690232.1 Alpha/Beta hydrolase protein [Talaromyces proteolyticus]